MKKGFTLLELLIVIAIIGLLAAIVVAMVTNARKRSDITFVKQSMSEIRKQAEIYAQDHGGSYGPTRAGWIQEGNIDAYTCSTCFIEDPKIKTLMKSMMPHVNVYDVTDQNKYFFHSISDNGTKWALAVWGMRIGPNAYCVDSSGKTTQKQSFSSSLVAANGVCVQ